MRKCQFSRNCNERLHRIPGPGPGSRKISPMLQNYLSLFIVPSVHSVLHNTHTHITHGAVNKIVDIHILEVSHSFLLFLTYLFESIRLKASQRNLQLSPNIYMCVHCMYIRAEGIKLFLEFHHFACFIQCTYMCRFRKSLYGNSSFTQKSENPLQKVSNLL